MRKILLDSHIVVWWLLDAPELSPKARAFLLDEDMSLVVSVATVWEISIKQAIGKLAGFERLLSTLQELGVELLDITGNHAVLAANLPSIHKDPFDRMLIAQASIENLPLLSADSIFQHYPAFPHIPA